MQQQIEFRSQSERQQDEIEALKSQSKHQQDEIKALKSQSKQQQYIIQALKEAVIRFGVGTDVFPLEFVVTNPHQYYAPNQWSSNHFYSHCCGYKLKLAFHYNIRGYWFCSYLMQGEFDDMLKWPMKIVFVLLLRNTNGKDFRLEMTAKREKRIIGGETYECGACSINTPRKVMEEYLHNNCFHLQIDNMQML